jgi:hypothetical protein
MRKPWFPPPAAFNGAEASDLVWKALEDADLVQTSTRSGDQINVNKVGQLLREHFLAHFTVENEPALRADPELAAWPSDAADLMFPGLDLLTAPSTDEEEAARDKLVAIIWGFCSLSLSGTLNKAVAGDGLYVAEKAVAKRRPAQGKEGGTPVTAVGRFVTADYDLLRNVIIDGDIVKFRKAAERLEVALKDHGDRRPEYRLAIAKYADTSVPSIVRSIVHADPKRIAAAEAEPRAAVDTDAPPTDHSADTRIEDQEAKEQGEAQ